MYEIIDVTNFEKIGYSKGTREKFIVKDNIINRELLFKYPAEYDGIINGDIWAEKIATEIGKLLSIPVQETFLAKNESQLGILIEYSLNVKEEELTEGALFLKKLINDFKETKRKYYTFKNIEKCIISEGLDVIDFLDTIFLDVIIGNTDRHSENWGIVKNYNINSKRIISAYDNGSSLGREFHSKKDSIPKSIEEIEKYANKALSCIRIYDDKKVSLFDFFRYILTKYPSVKSNFYFKLKILEDDKINYIINKIPNEYMENDLKLFVFNLLKIRKNKMIKIIEEEMSK